MPLIFNVFYMKNNNYIGFFGPETMTWRLYREPFFLLGGVRALLLQIAHPAVAEGVARFSNFQQDPFGRGYRTFEAMATIYFGDCGQAEATAARLWRRHEGINGEAAGAPFRANDPQLLLWVLATLTETTLQVYRHLPDTSLPPDWEEQFYEESKIAARLLHIPDEAYPPSLAAFMDWWHGMLNGPVLGSTERCREVAQSIVRHPRAPKKLAVLLAAGWLPESLCLRLGIPYEQRPPERLQRFLSRSGWWYRFLPIILRRNPAWQQAMYRIARAENRTGSIPGRFYFWLGQRYNVPLGIRLKN